MWTRNIQRPLADFSGLELLLLAARSAGNVSMRAQIDRELDLRALRGERRSPAPMPRTWPRLRLVGGPAVPSAA